MVSKNRCTMTNSSLLVSQQAPSEKTTIRWDRVDPWRSASSSHPNLSVVVLAMLSRARDDLHLPHVPRSLVIKQEVFRSFLRLFDVQAMQV